VGVEVRHWKEAWWVFVDHKRQRKAKRIGVGAAGKRAAEEVAKAYEVQLTLGTFDFSKEKGTHLCQRHRVIHGRRAAVMPALGG